MIHSEDCDPPENEKLIQVIESMIGKRVSWAFAPEDGYELLDRLQACLDRERANVDSFDEIVERDVRNLYVIPMRAA